MREPGRPRVSIWRTVSDSISVTVQLHPFLQRYRPRIEGNDPVAVSLPSGCDVDRLLTDACGLPVKLQLLVAVNGQRAPGSSVLRDGDRVRVFMPLSGG